MKSPDLVIRPADYLLGIWWATIPAGGKGHTLASLPMTDGGHWMMWIRRDVPEDGANPPVWHVWQQSRAVGKAWIATMSVLRCPTDGALNLAAATCLVRFKEAKTFTAGRQIRGPGWKLLRDLERDGLVLPPWMHVVVIQERETTRAPFR